MTGKIWQAIQKSLLHFVYPACCLHCKDSIDPQSSVFCENCASLLELIDPNERCLTCFDLKSSDLSRCSFCSDYPSLFYRSGAAFDYIGPAAALIKKLKYANRPYLAKGAGAFLVAQWQRLNWPLPDAIVPVPLSWSHSLDRGYNQSALLAEEMARFLHIPVWHALKRKSGDYSQAGLSFEQRRLLTSKRFKLSRKYELQDKVILVVDDVMTTGSTLRRCAEALSEGCPSTLYALTFCRTIE